MPTPRWKPLARAVRSDARWRAARIQAALAAALPEPSGLPTGFVVGCARSGTTILGECLGAHPDVHYLNEPYHLWAAFAAPTDAGHTYHTGPAHMLLDADALPPAARKRFWWLMAGQAPDRTRLLLEKTPHNALRIGFLRGMLPRARFVHLVRDGLAVVRSIEAQVDVDYRVGLRGDYHFWWGRDDARWTHLRRDAAAAGYFADEVEGISSTAGRAAYEWLVSLLEVKRWKRRLEMDLLELRYEDLLARPERTLGRVADFLGVSPDADWSAAAARRIVPTPRRTSPPLELPPRMGEAFDALQAEFGYPGRADSPGSRAVPR